MCSDAVSCTHVSLFPLSSLFRMKMRRHRVFLLCTVGLCVISFLHYYKALHYVSLLRELSAPYPNIKSFIMVTGFFWREKGAAATPLSPASPEEAPPLPVLRQSESKARAVAIAVGDGGGMGHGIGGVMVGGVGIVGNAGLEMRLRDEPAPPHPWEKPEENQQGDRLKEVRLVNLHYNNIYIESTKKVRCSNPTINNTKTFLLRLPFLDVSMLTNMV